MTEPQDDRYFALGQVVETAAVMEISLRMAFCALMNSEYAGVVAENQETHWLTESCDLLTRHHRALQRDQQNAIHAALQSCREANRARNRLVHDAWGTSPDGAPATIQTARGSYPIAGRAWTVGEIRTVADLIATAQNELLTAIEAALGTESLRQEEQLRTDDLRSADNA
jgi:hypothetical protein